MAIIEGTGETDERRDDEVNTYMKIHDIISEADSYQPPEIEVGDEVKIGKFKNRKAEVKGITLDKNDHPVLKTTKGDQQLFKPRISKLMPNDEKEENNV